MPWPARSAKPIARFHARFSLPGEQASFLKLLVEKGGATDHSAAPAPWAVSAFAHHSAVEPMEETNMS
jgi:hypothetical protein